MKTLAEILFLWQFSVFSSTSNIIFLFVKGRVIVYPRYLPLRAEVKITDIEDTLKRKQVEKSSFLKKKKPLLVKILQICLWKTTAIYSRRQMMI